MFRKVSLLLAVILSVSAFHVMVASAQGVDSSGQHAAAQTTPTCTDATFLKGIGTDFSAFGTTVSGTKMDDISAVAQAILSTAVVRQKYEDMSGVDPSCLSTQIAMIVALSNGSDLLSLQLASLADPNKDNATTYSDAIKAQTTRFQNSAQQILIQAGLATPTP